MLLSGYVPVPGAATVGGAPIDAFQADAFRQNDAFFEKLFRAVLASPLIPNGMDGPVPNPAAHRVVHATTISVNTTINLVAKVPLIWFAREKITINNTINAAGFGAQAGEAGDFGGSGGGGAAAGQPCTLPISGHQIIAGGAAGANGSDLPADWASRALAVLALCRGGAAGGDANGGAGGGVVFLCAPEIELSASGKIDAKGAAGSSGNAGGGGGGLVVLIARKLINVDDTSGAGSGQTVFVDGGAGAGTGGSGGKGVVLKREFS